MDILSIILSIATLLFGGCNILQLMNNRELKRKLAAESDQEESKSLRLIIDGNVSEIARLQQRLDEYTDRYNDLQNKYFELQDKFLAVNKELQDIKTIIKK